MIEKIKKVITVAENAGLKDNLRFIKIYTGYIRNDNTAPIRNGNRYIKNNLIKKKVSVKNKTKFIYDL